jgi:hypothetical protein
MDSLERVMFEEYAVSYLYLWESAWREQAGWDQVEFTPAWADEIRNVIA